MHEIRSLFFVLEGDPCPLRFPIPQNQLFQISGTSKLVAFRQDDIVKIKPKQYFPLSYLWCTCLVKIEYFYVCAQLHRRRNWKLHNPSERRPWSCLFAVLVMRKGLLANDIFTYIYIYHYFKDNFFSLV